MRNTTIEQQVMAAVAVVYTGRVLASAGALKIYALLFSVGGIVSFVSLPHVAANFLAVESDGVGNAGMYIVSAVVSTTLVVQIALALGTVAGILLVRDTVRRMILAPRRLLAL